MLWCWATFLCRACSVVLEYRGTRGGILFANLVVRRLHTSTHTTLTWKLIFLQSAAIRRSRYKILIFVRFSSEFLGISFNHDDQTAYLPYLSVTVKCFAADFLYADSAIYFTDDAKDVIGRINTDGSGMEYVITTGLNRPHGIAVDWVGRNLYWTDMGTKLIEVSSLYSRIFLFSVNKQTNKQTKNQ